MSHPRAYLVDSMNYIFRAYHALPKDITSPDGMMTNAVLGFVRTLLRIVKENKPEYVAVAFEGDTSYRNAVFPQYKATRQPTPPELRAQFDHCRQMAEAMGMACLDADGYEADDVIGTLARQFQDADIPVAIVSGDKDLCQLVTPMIHVYDFGKSTWLDESGVFQKFGVRPGQIPDLLSLIGDSVDNIPGVLGIGEKSARQILSVFDSLDELPDDFTRDSQVAIRNRDALMSRIRSSMDSVRRSRELATIFCDIPLRTDTESLRYRGGYIEKLDPLCMRLGFWRVLDEIPLRQSLLF